MKNENNNYIYHFVYNQEGKCISDNEKPSNTFLNKQSNTYELCYERCSSCEEKGNNLNNNCKECLKDENNNYKYHFVYSEKGKCIDVEEKPTNTYLDKKINTFSLCYERCSSCIEKGDNLNNNCQDCLKDENNNYKYHFVYNKEGKCISNSEKPSNTYLDKQSNTFNLCYERCSSCEEKGNNLNNNCKECLKDKNNNYIYHFIYSEEGKCISDNEKPSNTFLNKQSNTYELCYERCSSCELKGNELNNNCKECLKDENNNYKYHFIYSEEGKCIDENEKQSNTYLDKKSNTYKLCYEKCSLCEEKGDNLNNNCKDCLKDENNNYIYHFVYNQGGKCISDNEKPSNTFLNKQSNTYELCYERCSSCEEKGNNLNNNCKECLKDENNNYIYHFVYTEKGKCISENEKPSNTYLDKKTNTYELCYEKCASCEEKGNDLNNNCQECAKDEKNEYIFHFIYNEKGKCISSKEKPTNTYLDLKSNTFLKCYERCQSCESYPDCKECYKDESNKYLYHFINYSKGKCIKENELIEGFYYLDHNDNTYKKCPEGTVKVENNECIKNKVKIYIIIGVIIFIIILILIIVFCIMRRRAKKKKNSDLMEEAINLKELYD